MCVLFIPNRGSIPMSSSTPQRVSRAKNGNPAAAKPGEEDIPMEDLRVNNTEDVWGEEVPDDSKPIFKDDQTSMKPETVFLVAPNIYK